MCGIFKEKNVNLFDNSSLFNIYMLIWCNIPEGELKKMETWGSISGLYV